MPRTLRPRKEVSYVYPYSKPAPKKRQRVMNGDETSSKVSSRSKKRRNTNASQETMQKSSCSRKRQRGEADLDEFIEPTAKKRRGVGSTSVEKLTSEPGSKSVEAGALRSAHGRAIHTQAHDPNAATEESPKTDRAVRAEMRSLRAELKRAQDEILQLKNENSSLKAELAVWSSRDNQENTAIARRLEPDQRYNQPDTHFKTEFWGLDHDVRGWAEDHGTKLKLANAVQTIREHPSKEREDEWAKFAKLEDGVPIVLQSPNIPEGLKLFIEGWLNNELREKVFEHPLLFLDGFLEEVSDGTQPQTSGEMGTVLERMIGYLKKEYGNNDEDLRIWRRLALELLQPRSRVAWAPPDQQEIRKRIEESIDAAIKRFSTHSASEFIAKIQPLVGIPEEDKPKAQGYLEDIFAESIKLAMELQTQKSRFSTESCPEWLGSMWNPEHEFYEHCSIHRRAYYEDPTCLQDKPVILVERPPFVMHGFHTGRFETLKTRVLQKGYVCMGI